MRLGRCLRLSDEGHDGMDDRYMMDTAYDRWMMDGRGLTMAFNFPVSFPFTYFFSEVMIFRCIEVI